MALKSSASPSHVKKTFIFEVPNVMKEVKLLERSLIGRQVSPMLYEFVGLSHKFKGTSHDKSFFGTYCRSITVELKGAIIELTTKLNPGSHQYHNGNPYGSHDVKCLLDAELECENFQYKCSAQRKSYGALKGQPCQPHCSSTSMNLDKLKEAVPEHLKNHVCLRITTTWTVFDTLRGSSWVETIVPTSSVSFPFVKHMLAGKCSDFVIECDGKDFPAHSVVLRCMSPVFAAMLQTNMKEAVSGRIQIEDAGPGAVERMLGFMYSGQLTTGEDQNNQLPEGLITELLHLAEKYEILEMKRDLFAQVRAKLSVGNAIKFLKAAELYGAGQNVVKEILEFCQKNLMELPRGPELQEFIAEHLKELF